MVGRYHSLDGTLRRRNCTDCTHTIARLIPLSRPANSYRRCTRDSSGGNYRRTNPADNTGDWFSINGDIQVTEFHDIAYDPVSNIIIGGAQDTGTPQQINSGGTTWDTVDLQPDFAFRSAGDGGDVAVDDTSMPGFSIRYSSFNNLTLFRRQVFDVNNIRTNQTFPALALVGGGNALVPRFVTPVELNAIDPTRLIIGGANSTYESLDQGNTITEAGPGIGVNSDAVSYGGRQITEVNVLSYMVGKHVG